MTNINIFTWFSIWCLLLVSFGFTHDDGVPHNAFGVDNSMQFGQKVDKDVINKNEEEAAKSTNENGAGNVDVNTVADESVKKLKKDIKKESKGKKKFNVSEHRLLLSSVPDGRPYGVYNDILSSKTQVLLKTYLTFDNNGWLFNNYDPDDANKQRTHDNTPWLNEKDPLEFSKSKLCNQLLGVVRDVSKSGQNFYPYRVFGKIIRRGDHTLVSSDSNETGEFTALVFVNEFWRKNYYGELYMYDKAREIAGGATHQPGRVVVYESTILRLNRPPAVSFLQGQILFQVQFSTSQQKMHTGHKKWDSYIQEREEANKNWNLDYKLPNGDPMPLPNPEKHKRFEYTTKTDGRKIFVYDDLFPRELLDRLRNFVLKYGSYFYDDSVDKESDNVQWIAGFLLDPYIKSPYWPIVKDVAKHATGSDAMFPYDVSINLVRSSDHTRIHGDVGYYGENEFTCLVYLNPDWKKEYYGETTFFEKNSDDTEIVAQVRPRYGRTVIFDGNIPHSARPPSFNFTGARLTFVTKLHRNEYTGRKKNFQEEYRHLSSAINGIQEVKKLVKKGGEAYAKKQLDYLRKIKGNLSFRPDADDEQEEKEDTGGEDGEDTSQRNAVDTSGDATPPQPMLPGEGTPPQPMFVKEEESPFFDDEPEDRYSKELVSQLEDVKESSVDGVEKIATAHAYMKISHGNVIEKLGRSIIKVM